MSRVLPGVALVRASCLRCTSLFRRLDRGVEHDHFRQDDPEQETTLSILQKCTQLGCFDDLPDQVRAGYMHELGRRRQQISDFEEALEQVREDVWSGFSSDEQPVVENTVTEKAYDDGDEE